MESLTDSSAWPLDGDDTGQLLAIVVGVGLLCYCYGLAVEAGLLGTGWGLFAILPYVVLQVGALLLAAGGLVAWLRRVDRAVELRETVVAGYVAAVAAVVATVLVHWVGGAVSPLPQFLGWSVLGLAFLGAQFPLGFLDTSIERWQILAAEAAVVLLLVVVFLAVDREILNLASFLVVGLGGALLVVAAGGPLFLLGERLRAEN